MRIESISIGTAGFLLGAIIGGCTGYFWSEEKFRKRSDAEYSKYAEFIKNKKNEFESESPAIKAGSVNDEKKEEETKKEDEEAASIYKDLSSVYSDPQQREEEVVNYSGYSQEKTESGPEDLSPKEMDGIIKITERQFDEEYIGRYSKVSAVYYVKSHEMYDMEENQLDIDMVCDYEFLSSWPDNDHLFVRNTKTETDYDIEFLNEEYYHWQ